MSNASKKSRASTRNRLTAARIEKLRGELRGQLARLRRKLQEWPTDAWAAEQSRHMSADDLQPELRDRSDAQCAQILAALDRVQAGTYGYCAVCKEPIPYGRLEVVPETTTCVKCGALG